MPLVVVALVAVSAGAVRSTSGGAHRASSEGAKAPGASRIHGTAASRTQVSRATVLREVGRGSSLPVRELKSVRHTVIRKKESFERDRQTAAPGSVTRQRDGALQTKKLKTASPAPASSFLGITDSSQGVVTGYDNWPPDTVGDVGPNNYVEAVNTAFAVYNKTGQKIAGPKDLRSLWAGTNGLCKTHDDGDPIVLYDPIADRWLISQFAIQDPNDYEECIAISKTGDPAGAYWTYDILTSTKVFPDYPKFGVWPDAYYASYNNIDSSDSEVGSTVVAYDRASMLNGGPARPVSFVYSNTTSPLLPADLDGTTLPPAGSPGIFLGSRDGEGGDALILYAFHVDFTPATPTGTFTRLATLFTATFDSNMCNYRTDCIPQPGTAKGLDAESDRPMQRLAYRNLGGSIPREELVVNQTVRATGIRAGVRWYELRRTGGSWGIAQQGTYSPNATNRWMASAAMDKVGDIAVGYTASGTAIHPSVRYATRVPTDPLGSLQTEKTLFAGTGSYTNKDHRWGDYSAMSVDPTDDCTFWFAGEYAAAPTGPSNWRTRIGTFRLPSCH